LAADTLLLILKVESAAGTPDRQTAVFERVRSLVESDAGARFGPGFRARAMLVLAEIRLRARDTTEGERWIGKALAVQRRDDGTMPATLSAAIAESLQGIARLQRGRSAEALDSLRAAQGDVSKLFGPNDLVTNLFSLNTALALDALGRSSEALAIVEQAEPALRQAMGIDAPTYLHVKELQNNLERTVASGVLSPRNAGPAGPGAGVSKHPRIDFFN
jgi:hypothetical protein